MKSQTIVGAFWAVSLFLLLPLCTEVGFSAQPPKDQPAPKPCCVAAEKTPEISNKEKAVLQAKVHRLMADLIEAKAADEPDKKKIATLTKELQATRKKLSSSQASTSPAARPSEVETPAGRGRGYQWRGGRGPGHGGGRGRGWGRGGSAGAADSSFEKDRDMFHFLLDNRQAIKRKVKKTTDGVETLTESDDPKIATIIQEHVASMKRRVEGGSPIHMRDPLFAAVFSNAKKISMKVENTEKGARVTETSTDPYVARLIQAHAEVVNLFVANGRAEAQKNHPVPEQ